MNIQTYVVPHLFEVVERISLEDIWGKNSPVKGTANVLEMCLVCLGTSKEASMAGAEGVRGQRERDELGEVKVGERDNMPHVDRSPKALLLLTECVRTSPPRCLDLLELPHSPHKQRLEQQLV